jgi:hypothetical protein
MFVPEMIKRKNIVLDAVMAGLLFLMVLLMLMMSSCKHEPTILPDPITNNDNGNNNGNGNGNNNGQSTCDPDSVYFQTQVLPILISNCAKSGCHNEADHKEGVILNNYNNVMATADVNPGRPNNSDLYKVLVKSDPDDRMPPAPSSLTNDQINLVYKWIDQGARNNSCSNTCDTTNVTFSGTIIPLIQNSCIGCHSGPTPDGQIDLSNYQNIKTVALNGKLYGSVSHSTGFKPMPRGGNSLPVCQIDQIRIWIENGSLNN